MVVEGRGGLSNFGEGRKRRSDLIPKWNDLLNKGIERARGTEEI